MPFLGTILRNLLINGTKLTLDAKDRKILSALQQDSRLTMQELAERTGMSSSAVWRRVKSLEEAGIIDRYAAIVDTRKAGFGFSAIVHLTLARHEQKNVERFIKEVMRHPEVLECYATSGEADFHLRVVVEDIDAYNAFLDDFIFRLPGVSQVRSNIVLKEIKADTALPFRNLGTSQN
ncbi:MAG: Lrp/AsnC family transcriptional regulator [Woeseiaceae bacterium]|nr:Lrp/AsnC family transcriptional regulator [Gammaproteobacteria bacterium]NNK24321.1 Lrp/AsnC family transcriptional regulator [Woeseiaceae bacterium]